jgi:gliding motility-associated-like protein
MLLVPNVFTPNGDGANDEFRVVYRSIKEFHCWVYNRWGMLVYQWSDPAKGWDGTIGGRPAAEGAYFYVIRALGTDADENAKYTLKPVYKKQKEKQNEMLDKAISDKRSKLNKEKGRLLLGAVADWATGKSKALKGDIEDLKLDLAEAHEAIAEERKRTQAEIAKLEACKKSVAQQMESAVRNAVLIKEDDIRNLKERI